MRDHSPPPSSEAVRLQLFWGDHPLGVHLVAPNGHDTPVPLPEWPWLRAGAGEVQLALGPGLGGVLEHEGRPTPLLELAERGAQLPDDDVPQVAFERGDRARLRSGPFLVALDWVPVPPRAGAHPALDLRFVNVLLLAVLAGGLCVSTLVLRALAGDDFTPDLSARAERVLPPPPELARRIVAAHAPKARPERRRSPDTRVDDSKPRPQRATAPSGDRPASGLERDRVKRAWMGAVQDALERVASGGKGADTWLLAMQGVGVARAGGPGEDGLGGRLKGGAGAGGGGEYASLGIGPNGARGTGARGTRHVAEPGLTKTQSSPLPEFDAEPPLVCGGQPGPCGLDRSLIREVIHRNRAQVRACYEERLVHLPSLQGRVRVRFTIGAEGTVVQSGLDESDVRDAGLEQCLVRRVRGWRFPRTKTGGEVVVSYPFVFRTAGR